MRSTVIRKKIKAGFVHKRNASMMAIIKRCSFFSSEGFFELNFTLY